MGAEKVVIPSYGPFIHFTNFSASITLEERKYHFKVYPKSFYGEAAQQTLVSVSSCSREDATEFLNIYVHGLLISGCDRPKDTHDLKLKHLYYIGSKGELVIRDVKNGRVPQPESPEILYADPEYRCNIVYIERSNVGRLTLGSVVGEVLVKTLFGDKPNIGKKDKDKGESSLESQNENLGSRNGSITNLPVDDGGAPVPIRPILLRDRTQRLKSYPLAFAGSDLVDWLLQNTSCLSREEGLMIASALVSAGWVVPAGSEAGGQTVSPDRASTPSTVSSSASQAASNLAKDSKNNLYQPSSAACKLAGWTVEPEAPSAKPVRALFRKLRDEGADANGDASGDDTDDDAGNNNAADGGSGDVLKRGDRNSFSKGSDGMSPDGPTQADLIFEWETCHLNPVSMNGTEGRLSKVSANGDGKLLTAASIANAARQKRLAAVAAKSLTKSPTSDRLKVTADNGAASRRPSNHSGDGTKRRPSSDCGPRMMSSEAPSQIGQSMKEKTDFHVDQIKESNPTRLIQILTNEDLREAFHLFVRSVFCEENLYFWEDVHALRNLYSGTIVIPGQPVGVNSSAPHSPLLIPHAMALYLKYIITDAPFEVNVNISIKKAIEAVMAHAAPYFQHIDPDALVPAERIDPAKIIALPTPSADVNETLAKFPKDIEKLTAALFDAAEHHIFMLMANDSVVKFIKTSVYSDIMTELFVTGKLAWRAADQPGLLMRRSSVEGTMDTVGSNSDATGASSNVSALVDLPPGASRRKSSIHSTTSLNRTGLMPSPRGAGAAGGSHETEQGREGSPARKASTGVKEVTGAAAGVREELDRVVESLDSDQRVQDASVGSS
ncbi:hypothetical protein HK101_003277 [Irineochytrium annulatum]|nr:hypothetical protein HK101_003277 [Irineochytrium annulatum]